MYVSERACVRTVLLRCKGDCDAIVVRRLNVVGIHVYGLMLLPLLLMLLLLLLVVMVVVMVHTETTANVNQWRIKPILFAFTMKRLNFTQNLLKCFDFMVF